MDSLNTGTSGKRSKRTRSGEIFGKQVNEMSQDEAATKGQHNCNTPKCSDGLQVIPEDNDGCRNLQGDVQKQNLSLPQNMSPVPTNNCPSSPCVLSFLPAPNLEESSPSLPVVLKGTADKAVPGLPVGAVDIGTSKSAYYFRVSLPGVKKDPGQFSCVIDLDGGVLIRGVTTTSATAIMRHYRVYKMKVHQLCLPGPFTLSFCLPGPVDPRMFSPIFRTDGIFEGVVMKFV